MKESHNNRGVQTWNLCNKPVYKQGCYALAAPGGPWQLTFSLRLLGNPFFPMDCGFHRFRELGSLHFLESTALTKGVQTAALFMLHHHRAKLLVQRKQNDFHCTVEWLTPGHRGDSLIWPKQVSVAAQGIVFRLWSFKKSEAKVRWVV